MTAGHNALRGSGPGQKLAFDNALAQMGCPDRRIDRLYGCTDQACNVKILLANSEPSAHGPIATFRCAVEFGRYRGIADIESVAPIKLDL